MAEQVCKICGKFIPKDEVLVRMGLIGLGECKCEPASPSVAGEPPEDFNYALSHSSPEVYEEPERGNSPQRFGKLEDEPSGYSDTGTDGASKAPGVAAALPSEEAIAVLRKLKEWDDRYPRGRYKIVEYGSVERSEKQLDEICDAARAVLAMLKGER